MHCHPLLALNEDKIYALTAGSPAINQAYDKATLMLDNEEVKDDDPMMLLDIDGQQRDDTKDIGSDEFSKASKTFVKLSTSVYVSQ